MVTTIAVKRCFWIGHQRRINNVFIKEFNRVTVPKLFDSRLIGYPSFWRRLQEKMPYPTVRMNSQALSLIESNLLMNFSLSLKNLAAIFKRILISSQTFNANGTKHRFGFIKIATNRTLIEIKNPGSL